MKQDLIDVFLFDLGKVLVHFSHDQMFLQIANLTGVSQEGTRTLFVERGLFVSAETGSASLSDVANKFREDASQTFTDQEFLEAMSNIFSPNQPMVALLPRLKAMGKRLVLVSNTSAMHFEWELAKSPWLALFDEHVLSYQIGAMKPHPSFYSAALQAAKAPAERCVFIDDLKANIAGAKQAGIPTHHFVDADSFLNEFSWINSR